MSIKQILAGTVLLGVLVTAMVGCEADGTDGGGTGAVGGSGGAGGSTGSGDGSGIVTDDNTVFPNEGSVGGVITDNGAPITGHFICRRSAQSAFGAITTVGANQLIGGPLSDLVNMLGGNNLTALLNSVADKDLVIDGLLATFARFSLPLDLAGILDSIDLSVLPSAGLTIPAGGYAVFAVTFPAATVELSLVNNITVTTYLDNAAQESVTLDQNALDLLGQGVAGDRYAFIGVRVHQPYDRATLSLTPSVLSADVGDAMHAHELCTGGDIVP